MSINVERFKEFHSKHVNVWNKVIELLSDYDYINSSNKSIEFEDDKIWDRASGIIKDKCFQDLKYKVVHNHCYGCALNLCDNKGFSSNECYECMFNVDHKYLNKTSGLFHKCLNDYWSKFYNSVSTLVKNSFTEESYNKFKFEAIKYAQIIRDFKLKPEYQKILLED